MRLELLDRIAQQELGALALDVLLDDGGGDFGEYVRQDARREVDDGQFADALVDALGALETDQARADDKDALVVRVAQHRVQALRVVERHEAGFVLDRVQPGHRRHERPRACADAQLVVGDGLAALESDGLDRAVDLHDLFAEHRGDVIYLVEVGRAVLEHFLLGRLTEQHIGDQRAAVNVIRLFGDDRDRAGLIDRTDALDRADGGGAVADDNVVHSAHLSS